MGLRITTWNVNGIRNPFGYQPWSTTKTFESMFDILEADIVIMQELKIQRKDLKDDMVLVPGWDCFFSLPKHKKGYSGVGIYTRQSACCPIRAEEGLLGVLTPPDSSVSYRDLPEEDAIGGYLSHTEIIDLGVDPLALDAEGRCVILEFPAFVLFGVYSPANSNGLRDDYRRAFLTALDTRIRKLDRIGKRVVLTGDLNVSRCELDTAGGENDRIKDGLTHEQYISTPNRRIFNQLLEGGEVAGRCDDGREKPVLWDVCRGFHEGRTGMYTHWEQKINARPGNHGSRIDFVLVSSSMKSWMTESNIQEGLMGSDHCPVYAVIADTVSIDGTDCSIQDIMNPTDIMQGGRRLRDVGQKDLLAFSARKLPEFDLSRRRNIKDMFKRQPSSSSIPPPPPRVTQPASPAPFASPSQSPRASIAVSPSRTPATKRKPQADGVGAQKKKPKPTPVAAASTKGQGTLRAFFRPAAVIGKSTPVSNNTNRPHTLNDNNPPRLDMSVSITGHEVDVDDNANPGKPKEEAHPTPPTLNETTSTPAHNGEEVEEPTGAEEDVSWAESVESRIDNSHQWGNLFKKRQPPLCEDHEEPCICLDTKKKGFNCGRKFWMCPRPVGPSGAKEKNTQWRCRTFIWASDWNGLGNSG